MNEYRRKEFTSIHANKGGEKDEGKFRTDQRGIKHMVALRGGGEGGI